MRVHRLLAIFAACIVAAALAACGDDDEASLDAAVTADSDAGSCEPGSQGCPCAAGERCGPGTDGSRLGCVSGLCQPMTCDPGAPGCICKPGSACDKGAECKAGSCQPKDCERGSLHCGCLGGTCDPGLYCTADQLCADAAGHEGGACLENGACLQGNRCDSSLMTCVACELGSEGCQCTAANGCNTGLACAAKLCVSAALLPPKDPKCYTPCLQALSSDAQMRTCDADGLIAGCIADKQCRDGSCLDPGADAPSCHSDSECPFFQTCLQDRCYSNCEQNADCPTGLGCYRKVCRVPCSGEQGGAACPVPMSCVADDGSLGFCSPYVPTSASPASKDGTATQQGGLSLDRSSVQLDNLHPQTRLRLRDAGKTRSDVVVHKLWHLVHKADGTSQRVDAPRDPATGEFKDCDAARGECPLDWLELAAGEQQATRARKLELSIPAACSGDTCPTLRIDKAGNGAFVRWEGELLLSSKTGTTRLSMTYVQSPQGRWTGSLFYLGNFADQGLADWMKGDKGSGDVAKNGLIQVWSAFRRGALDDYRELLAVLTATRTESWKFDRVKELCGALTNNSPTAVCYPHGNPAGVRVYTQNANNFPVPSGVTELPIAVQLRAESGDGASLSGIIDSESALQYPSRPRVSLRFDADPGAAEAGCDSHIRSDCVVFVREFGADITVGGRYLSPDGKCAQGYQPVSYPWLLRDFVADTAKAAQSSARTRNECRSSQLPFSPADNAAKAANLDLSAANPAPDGLARARRLRLLDGALVNQNDLIVLFEETFPSFLPGANGAEVKAYGFMLLTRDPRELSAADYQPGATVAEAGAGPSSTAAACAADLVARAGSSTPDSLVTTLLKGRGGSSDYVPISGSVYAHYLCEETGVFDNGYVTQANAAGLGCPVGSAVTYFLTNTASLNEENCQRNVACDVELKGVDGGVSNLGSASSIDANGLVVKCRTPGTCKSRLNEWIASGKTVVERDPLWQCATGSYCDANRFDLRAGKTFYRYVGQQTARVPLAPLRTAIDQAFRYKSRFVSDTGQNVGFAPQVCQPGSDQIPYCYDPTLIEDVRGRIDCLLDIYTNQIDSLSTQARSDLEGFLRGNFSQFEPSRDGFERLYAELLTMLGDEALSSSFASRFDLAATNSEAFLGSELERGGVDLSGVAGFELFKLYQGLQYYQLALDRMYGMGKQLATALSRGATSSTPNFISPETVTLYLERLAGGSSKKARAWDEVAKRYLSLNRADLARGVVSREYVRTYLESVLLSKLMTQIVDASRSANRDQLRAVIEQTQRGYRTALLGMSDVYRSIDDSTTVFGFPPDYIPFPALDSGNINDTNAFEVLALVANRKIDAAAAREEVALTSARSGRTDAATFQSELVRVRNAYEDQLSEVCGTFAADDGRIVPATDKYAALSEATRLMGDPCGRVGNGQIKDAYVVVEDAKLAQRGASTRAEEIISEIEIERQRVSRQCKLSTAVADYEFESGTRKLAVSKQIADVRFTMGVVQRTTDTIVQGASTMANCDGPVGCVSAGIAAGVVVTALSVANAVASVGEAKINEKEHELGQMALDSSHWVAMTQCDAALIDSDARTRGLALGLAQSEIELLRANLQVNLAVGNIQRLLNQAKRLRGQQREAEQMLINVEAARNDPNVRVYRNDAIINADFTFDDALRAVYRATRVYEYYTSQSYAAREQLFLVRMATAGQYNLQNYMQQLQNAFADFEEQFGVPDTRVMVLSLRDDVLKIPLLNAAGDPYTREQRIAQLRERLRDPGLLDASGRLVIPFGIAVSDLSPVTRNHKVRYVEIDVVGSDVGDTLGRFYVQQAGTSTIRNLADGVDYYAFPERLAVINTFFNGSRVYGPEVYRSLRLRDRPAANSLYKLTINQRDETVNKDINLQSLSDIRLLLYYDDFTKL